MHNCTVSCRVAGTIHRRSATVEERKKFVKAAKPEVLWTGQSRVKRLSFRVNSMGHERRLYLGYWFAFLQSDAGAAERRWLAPEMVNMVLQHETMYHELLKRVALRSYRPSAIVGTRASSSWCSTDALEMSLSFFFSASGS